MLYNYLRISKGEQLCIQIKLWIIFSIQEM